MEIEFSEKISTQLSAALLATPEELASSDELASGYEPETASWEVIVKYIGDIENIKEEFPSVIITKLLGNYAVLIIEETLVNRVAMRDEIIYMEKPKQFNYGVYQASQASCITPVRNAPYNLSGRGVLVAIIDSGIYYAHPDFIEHGRSRIEFLWDQTIPAGNNDTSDYDPDNTVTDATSDISNALSNKNNVPFGTLYDRDTITAAINAATYSERQAICPSVDISGHGTHVAGIAAGNGNASNGTYRGVAYESSLIVVKLATSGGSMFPTTTQIMLAVDFCIRKSIELKLPVAINLSFGTNSGSHSGTSLLETYIDFIAENYRCSIIAGSGNDGTGYSHAGGSSYPATTEFTIGQYEPSLSLFFWKKYWDEIRIQLVAPDGTSISVPDTLANSGKGFSYRYELDRTNIYITGGGPSPYSPFQEIYVEFSAKSGSYITSGIWQLRLSPISVKDGTWDIWLPSASLRGAQTAFVYATPDITLTLPSTAMNVITVGAYDSRTNRTAAFSGRGYTWAFDQIKPDLAAPGVDIVSCSPQGGYTSKTGTSMAAPFVTGSAALLMEWGIVRGNDRYMYGDKLKACLIKGARENIYSAGSSLDAKYPNPVTGWGTLCLLDSIP